LGETKKGETKKGETKKGETKKGETKKGETKKGETKKGFIFCHREKTFSLQEKALVARAQIII
jgi:hypothetical protein